MEQNFYGGFEVRFKIDAPKRIITFIARHRPYTFSKAFCSIFIGGVLSYPMG